MLWMGVTICGAILDPGTSASCGKPSFIRYTKAAPCPAATWGLDVAWGAHPVRLTLYRSVQFVTGIHGAGLLFFSFNLFTCLFVCL